MTQLNIDKQSMPLNNHAAQIDSYYELIRQSRELNKQGNATEAIAILDQATKIQPDYPDAYQETANILRQESRLDEMVQYLIKAINICPTFREPYHCLALLDFWSSWDLISPELLELAIATCQESLKPIPFDDLSLRMLIHSTIGDLLTAQNNLHQAIASFQTSANLALKEKGYENNSNSNQLKANQGPDFFIIGGMKCGTSSLRLYLARHPQVVTPVKKEIHFFNTEKYNNGLDWYLSYFSPKTTADNFISGEATPCLNHYGIWHKIHKHFPNIKLILLLRNPVDRTLSHYHHIARGLKHYHSFEQEIKKDLMNKNHLSTASNAHDINRLVQSDCIGGSLYVYWLKEWLKIFSRENILILESEDFYQNTSDSMEQVHNFLELEKHHLSTYSPANQGSYTRITPSLRKALSDYFRPHNQQLMELLNIEFSWC